MVLVDYTGIFFTCGNTFGHILYIYINYNTVQRYQIKIKSWSQREADCTTV